MKSNAFFTPPILLHSSTSININHSVLFIFYFKEVELPKNDLAYIVCQD